MNLPLRRNTALSADLDEAQPGRVSRPATSKHTAGDTSSRDISFHAMSMI
jgi:hypothetical protein